MQGKLFLSATLAIFVSVIAHAETTGECDPGDLVRSYADMVNSQIEHSEKAARCAPGKSTKANGSVWDEIADPTYWACVRNLPRPIPEKETIDRLKRCADAGSATGAGLFAHDIVTRRLPLVRMADSSPEAAETRRKLEREMGSAIPTTQDVASEALNYFQLSYRLDSNQAASAEGVGDLLASGDVGAGRRFEALDWYFKAGTTYLAWDLPEADKRQQATRILEKMAGIDRENPLTKRLEQQLYKQ